MIRIASVALPKSHMNLAHGDEVPQIITRITRQRLSEFLTSPANRLFATHSGVEQKSDFGSVRSVDDPIADLGTT
jgi:hypothetical protein